MTGNRRPPVPEDWEFRLSPDRRLFAFYDPGNGPWFVPEPAMRGRFVDSADMDAMNWYRYVPAESADPANGTAAWTSPRPWKPTAGPGTRTATCSASTAPCGP